MCNGQVTLSVTKSKRNDGQLWEDLPFLSGLFTEYFE